MKLKLFDPSLKRSAPSATSFSGSLSRGNQTLPGQQRGGTRQRLATLDLKKMKSITTGASDSISSTQNSSHVRQDSESATTPNAAPNSACEERQSAGTENELRQFSLSFWLAPNISSPFMRAPKTGSLPSQPVGQASAPSASNGTSRRQAAGQQLLNTGDHPDEEALAQLSASLVDGPTMPGTSSAVRKFKRGPVRYTFRAPSADAARDWIFGLQKTVSLLVEAALRSRAAGRAAVAPPVVPPRRAAQPFLFGVAPSLPRFGAGSARNRRCRRRGASKR